MIKQEQNTYDQYWCSYREAKFQVREWPLFKYTAVQAGIVLRTLAAFQKAVELCADGTS